MKKVGAFLYTAACVLWFLLVASPGFLLYVIGLGCFSLDLRFDHASPLFVVPGWGKSEIVYWLPRWRPF